MATDGMAFGAALRRLRLAAGLTQARLSERAGVSVKAIAGLENDPARTPRLDTITRLADALGLDQHDRSSLLAAARPARALQAESGPGENCEPVPVNRPTVSPHAPERQAGTAPSDRQAGPTRAPQGRDWGEAPDVGALHGRSLELATLSRWVLTDGCRIVAIVGTGGIGKTVLAARLAHELASQFDAVYWRSMRNAPPPPDWLVGAIGLVSDQQVLPAPDEEGRLLQLLGLLRARRTLVVLDNFETVLAPAAPAVGYRAEYEGYGQMLEWLGETGHQSWLILTGREVPPEVSPRAGLQGPVRALRLGGLDTTAGRRPRPYVRPRGT